ncbi:MAG: isoleucine--tRNA ligase [Planctomycetota bacterium]|jgi:isoleucyl-tRNA synthetase
MTVFKPVENQKSFADNEADILSFWKDRDIFNKQINLNTQESCSAEQRDYKSFVFYEGPPTANGIPHPGHVLTRVIKDVFLRYKSMQGFDVQRKAGWDTHGLPVEIEVEKILGIEGKEGIEEYGIEPFVKKCKDSVFKYSDLWTKMTERIGFWIDLDDPYVTYHQEYIESVWWILKKFWDAGLLYHGHKIVPYCPRCGTALSSHEVGQGYKEVFDPSLFVTFKVKGEEGLSFLAWTTTPWTLISNAALAVGVDYDYDYVSVNGETLILASALREKCLDKVPHEIIKTVKGSEIVGMEYEQLFKFMTPEKPAFRVVAGDFVGLDTGSGIVHMAPAFGEDDYRVASQNDIPVINAVEPNGTFSECITPWKGMFVKDADKLIIKELKDRKQVLKIEQYKHDYPFCWRCDSALIYYARPTWYIRTTSIKDEMLKNNAEIDWHPLHIKEGRFGNFLETNVDWALSRERYWGTPLPIWQCSSCSYQTAVGSLEELKEKAVKMDDEIELHKPYVDDAELVCPECSSNMKRVPEVIDCWFDSGAMPLAQWGYPHAEGSVEKLKDAYPAAFITEAIDQTRGWFYSLLAISTLLKKCSQVQQDKLKSGDITEDQVDNNLTSFLNIKYPAPYRRCLVLGHVCDEKGYKMSKSKGNYLDPWEIMDQNGADAMRWYFYSSNNPWVSVRFFKSAIRDAQKDFLVRLKNIYQFFVIYANIDGFNPAEGAAPIASVCDIKNSKNYIPLADRSRLDKWIMSKLENTFNGFSSGLDNMDILSACKSLDSFVDGLSNWYVRRSRDRFWKSEKDTDKWSAYWTLYECLMKFSLAAAPVIPFMAEDLYQSLAVCMWQGLPESVHLHKWPESFAENVDVEIEAQMDLVREIASLGHSARAGQKIKVRQPLGEAIVILADNSLQKTVSEMQDVICDELNVKKLTFTDDAEKYVSYEVKPNFKALGPKLGKDMKKFASAISQLDATGIYKEVSSGNQVNVSFAGGELTVGEEELDVRISALEGYVAAQGLKCVVILDTVINPDLEKEGIARELVSRIQALRKEVDLAYEDRINTFIYAEGQVSEAVKQFEDYISGETLSVSISTDYSDQEFKTEFEVEGTPVKISFAIVEKVT